MSEQPHNLSTKLYEFSCVLELLRFSNEFGLPNGLFNRGLDASPRLTEAASLHFDLLGSLWTRSWTLLELLGPGFWTILGYHFLSKI